MRAPLLLAADNFTPPKRTPWGGTRILDDYKAHAPVADDRRYDKVGESWEVSVEPDFPSRVADGGPALGDVLAADPLFAIGREAGKGRTATALLVKLLDTAEPLSVQIHPADDYPGLQEGEAGKPESWYVLEAAPRAGLYLGLAPGTTRASMERAIREGDDVSKLLGFVPVSAGDFFLIEAGTAHAIGPGLTLIEPQHVAPGRRGVTYRYWDWNRRYDAAGRPATGDGGAPRPLHVEKALAVTDWDAPRGEAFLKTMRRQAGVPDRGAPLSVDPLAGPDGPLRSAHLEVERIAGSGEIELNTRNALRSLTVIEGQITLRGEGFEVAVSRGRSAVLPAGLGTIRAHGEAAHGLLCAIP
ncbi:MAG: class I mannose-6-phosphate isomerase [Deltaproteobacteria bacterium]|nr:class I mannose-6-phosphate isomerase [Deltaproteobacteria bacterium]